MSEHGPTRVDLEQVRRTLADLESDMYEREPGSGDIHWYQPIFECLERLPTDERAAWRERHGDQVRRILRPAPAPAEPIDNEVDTEPAHSGARAEHG